MTISFDKNRNKYCVQVTVKGHRYQGRFDTKKEAKDFEASCRLSEGPESNALLGDWLLTYLTNYKKPTVSETSYRTNKQTAAHLAPLANYRIKNLPSLQVQKLYNDLSTKYAENTVRRVHRLLKECLNEAYVLGLINKPPLQGVKAPTVHKTRVEVFTNDEIKKIREALTDSTVDLYFLTLMITGARPSELLALRPMAVRENSIFICENKKNLSGQVFGRTKTDAGIRDIPIPVTLAKKLKTHQNFVFQTSTGTAYSIQNVNRDWRKLLARAGVEYKKLYTLRHTFGTHMLANGMPLHEVSKLMGHENPTITVEYYGHAIHGYEDITAEKQLAIFGAV